MTMDGLRFEALVERVGRAIELTYSVMIEVDPNKVRHCQHAYETRFRGSIESVIDVAAMVVRLMSWNAPLVSRSGHWRDFSCHGAALMAIALCNPGLLDSSISRGQLCAQLDFLATCIANCEDFVDCRQFVQHELMATTAGGLIRPPAA